MSLKKKNDVTNKTVNAAEKKSRIKKVIAIILAILLMFCLLCEIIYTVCCTYDWYSDVSNDRNWY